MSILLIVIGLPIDKRFSMLEEITMFICDKADACTNEGCDHKEQHFIRHDCVSGICATVAGKHECVLDSEFEKEE